MSGRPRSAAYLPSSPRQWMRLGSSQARLPSVAASKICRTKAKHSPRALHCARCQRQARDR
eukprot:13529385-Alexandrium_andersonii.AAC.1